MRALLYIVTTALLLLAAACVRHSESWATLDRADAVMEEQPDSALALLQGIDSSTLNGDEEKARYALLLTMAMDKNYIDVADDSLINIANEYFEGCQLCHENMLAAFYKARIMLNAGMSNEAIKNALNSLEKAELLNDTLWMARCNEIVADIYTSTFAYKSASDHRSKAADMYNIVGKKLNEVYAKGEMTLEFSSLKQFDRSVALIDSLIKVSYTEYPYDSVLQANLLSISLRVYTYAGQYGKAIESLKLRETYKAIKPMPPSDYIDASYIHLHFNNLDEAKRLAEIADSACSSFSDRLNIAALKYSICRDKCDSDIVFAHSDTLFNLIDDGLIQIASNSVLDARGDYMENVSEIYRRMSVKKSAKIDALFEIIVLVVIISVLLACLMARFRKHSIIRTMENTNLLGALDDIQKKMNCLIEEKIILSVENRGLKSDNADIVNEKSIIAGRLSQLAHENDVLNSKIDEISACRDTILREKDRLSNQLKDTDLENGRLYEERAAIIRKIEDKTRHISNLEETIHKLQSERNDNAKAEKENRQATVANLKDNDSSFSKRFSYFVNIINSMSVQYITDLHTAQSKTVMKEKLNFETQILRDPATATLIKMSVDDIYGGIISKIKQAIPNITEENLNFLAFILAGVNYRIIAHIMGIKYDSVASKKMRLFKKIREVNIDGWNEVLFNKIRGKNME